jgi:dihydroxy-acid dehydratase
VIFNTITVSDGISMGTPGMRYSLVSREVIADSIETVVGGEGFDGFVAIGGCDKNMPGCVMAMARLDRPSVFVYGGTIRPGAKRRDIVSVFEAVGGHARGTIVSDAELKEVERTAIPGPGSCGGMYTANTMASAIEALGLSLPNSSAQEAVSGAKPRTAGARAPRCSKLLERGIRPSDILTREAFENAITVTIALGGSTNAVLHLLAIADAAGVPLALDDFTRDRRARAGARGSQAERQVPDVRADRIGGIRPLMKMLLDEGLLHGGCLTVTADAGRESRRRRAVSRRPGHRPAARRADQEGQPPRVLYGNLAPEGAVAKITGKEGERFVGPRACSAARRRRSRDPRRRIVAGDVVVIRYEGPKGGARHAARCSPRPARSWAAGWATRSR